MEKETRYSSNQILLVTKEKICLDMFILTEERALKAIEKANPEDLMALKIKIGFINGKGGIGLVDAIVYDKRVFDAILDETF